MRLYTINPFEEVERLQRQVNRAFQEVTGENQLAHWSVAVELEETAEAFILRALVPGVDRQDLSIEATRENVAISGEYRRPERNNGDYRFYSEFPNGKFRRVISLPLPIANDEVKADYAEGILTLTLPKAPEAINRVVKVSLNGTEAAAQIEPETANS